MTPAQIEHLDLLKSHLEKLLAGAKERTPGKWKNTKGKHGTIIRLADAKIGEPQDVCRVWNCSRREANAAFIASCAGNAERGWQSLLMSIEWLTQIYDRCDEPTSTYADKAIQGILAEWPLETLQK